MKCLKTEVFTVLNTLLGGFIFELLFGAPFNEPYNRTMTESLTSDRVDADKRDENEVQLKQDRIKVEMSWCGKGASGALAADETSLRAEESSIDSSKVFDGYANE